MENFQHNQESKKGLYRTYYACRSCGFEDVRYLTDMEAAFEETRRNPSETYPCNECGALKWSYRGGELPNLNESQMAKWVCNENLFFVSEDEDIILAHEENLSLLVKYLDSDQAPDSNKAILFNALCILLYRNIHSEKVNRNVVLAKKVKEILAERIELFSKVENQRWYISDYVAEVIYPELNLSFKPSYINELILSKKLSDQDIVKAVSLALSIESETVVIYNSEDEFRNTDSPGKAHIIKTVDLSDDYPLSMDIWSQSDLTDEQFAKVFVSLFRMKVIIENLEASTPYDHWILFNYPSEKSYVNDNKLIKFLEKNYCEIRPGSSDTL